MLAIIMFDHAGWVLWCGVVAYGFFNGPTIGYIYDLCNRTTVASEKGMSIVMFGLNSGASLVPYFVSFMWLRGVGPMSLPFIVMVSHVAPVPCQWLIRRLTVYKGARVTLRHSWRVLFGPRLADDDDMYDDDDDTHDTDDSKVRASEKRKLLGGTTVDSGTTENNTSGA